MLHLDLPCARRETRYHGSPLLVRRYLRRIAIGPACLKAEHDPGSDDRLALGVACLNSDGLGATPGLSPDGKDYGQGEKAGNQGQAAVVMVHRIPLRLRQREANLFDHCSEQLTLREALGQAVVSG